MLPIRWSQNLKQRRSTMEKIKRVAAPRVQAAHFGNSKGQRVETKRVGAPLVSSLKVEGASRTQARVHRAELERKRRGMK